MPPALQLDHLVLPTFDPVKSHYFYSEVLGLPLVAALEGDDWHGLPWLMMLFALGDGREVVLVARRGAPRASDDGVPKDVRHIAFAVPSVDAQHAWRTRLREHGVDVREEDHGTQQSIYFDDPDGTVLEITTPPSAAAATRSDAAAEALVASWLSVP